MATEKRSDSALERLCWQASTRHSISRSIQLRLPSASAALFCVTAATAALFLLFRIVGSDESITSRMSVDDSFYYLQMAWQTARTGFVTFDGVHEANGIQFLWFVLLCAIALLSSDKSVLLQSAYVVALCLVLVVYSLIWRVGTLLNDRPRHLTLLFALLWTVVLAGKSNQLFVGMESTLHMATLWGGFVAFLTFAKKLDTEPAFPGVPFLVLSGCLVLMTWTRLDSAVYSVMLYAASFWMAFEKHRGLSLIHLKSIWLSSAVISAGAAIQFSFYLYSAGTIIPISGLVKAASAHNSAAELLRSFVSILFPFGSFAAAYEAWFPAIGGSAFLLLFVYVMRHACRAGAPLHRVFQFAALLGMGAIIFAAVSCSRFDNFSRWYLSPVYMFYILGSGCFLYRSLYEATNRSRRIGPVPVILALVLYLTGASGLTVSHSPTPLYLARYQLGQMLREETSPNDVLAAFNAGQLAYFSDRKLINLDGLVNDRRFLESVLGRPEALMTYLRENDVRYLVDYDFYWAKDAVEAATAMRYSFPILGDRFARVLYVREVGR